MAIIGSEIIWKQISYPHPDKQLRQSGGKRVPRIEDIEGLELWHFYSTSAKSEGKQAEQHDEHGNGHGEMTSVHLVVDLSAEHVVILF
jgi:hypothetical protein